MRNIIIGKNEDGTRLDRLLEKYLKEANKSFVYKMLRKKNITLNDKKACGNEKLKIGDEIKLWLSEETIEKFSNKESEYSSKTKNMKNRENISFDVERIVYEDEDILLYNKPSGLLSQKADKIDISLNELFIDYLLKSRQINENDLRTFKPSICNRIDRNTSGLVILGKNVKALQTMNKIIQDRSVQKYYICVVKGKLTGKRYIKAWLYKDEKTNKVIVRENEFKSAKYIETEYESIYADEEKSLLKVKLLTGRSHQIRAHLSFIGHEILGDVKYSKSKDKNLKNQLLHSYELIFPVLEDFPKLSKHSYIAKVPGIYEDIVKEYKWEHGKLGG